jgi:hypothetical protein
VAFGGKVGPAEALCAVGHRGGDRAATLIQVAWLKLRGRKVDTMLWSASRWSWCSVALPIWFHSETFIKWKPSVLYWAMGLSFWLSPCPSSATCSRPCCEQVAAAAQGVASPQLRLGRLLRRHGLSEYLRPNL